MADADVDAFVRYCAEFGKSYINQTEFKMRLKSWKKADDFIKKHNWNPRASYFVSHNKFSDWTQREYEKLLGFAPGVDKQTKDVAP